MTGKQVAWEPGLSVGIELMDRQHREMFEAALRFKESLVQVCAPGGCGPDDPARHEAFLAMTRLRELFAAHFAAEETLMARARYLGLTEHKQDHDNCLVQLMAFERALLGGQTVIMQKVSLGLPLWLRQHIVHQDLAYIPFLTKQEEAAPERGHFDAQDEELLRELFENNP